MTLTRRTLFASAAASVAAAATVSLPRTAAATAPMADGPLPGVVRRRIGSAEVTALLDGYMEMPAGLFSAPQTEADRLQAQAFKQGQPILSPVMPSC